MILMILAGLLILGIAIYQAAQGAFSALIMAILSILAAAVALNFYEPLAGLITIRQGAYAHPGALLALFVIPLLVLRIVFDKAIPGNMVTGPWEDRLIGGVFGIVTGLVLVGMFSIIVQMLPMYGNFLTYQPYDEQLAVKQGGPPRWAAKFTLGLARHLSAGPFQAIFPPNEPRWNFKLAHDDLLLESFCVRNRPNGGSTFAAPGSLEIGDAYFIPPPPRTKKPADYTPAEAEQAYLCDPKNVPYYRSVPDPGVIEVPRVLVVRTRVEDTCRDRDEETGWYRLPATHFRLVCHSGNSYYPVAYLTYAGHWVAQTAKTEGSDPIAQVAQLAEFFAEDDKKQWGAEEEARRRDRMIVNRPKPEGGLNKLAVDWAFRLPAEEVPQYMVFRRTALAPIEGASIIQGLPKSDGALTTMPAARG